MDENFVYRTLSSEEVTSMLLDESLYNYAEHSFYWFNATIEHVLKHSYEVSWHCLFQKVDNNLSIALPLIKYNRLGIRTHQSVLSCYANSINPFCSSEDKDILFDRLIRAIKQNIGCDKIRLGPITEGGNYHRFIVSQGVLHTVFAQADNWYTKQLTSIEEYLQRRPSQLKNTIKRKQKKLDKDTEWNIQYASDQESFECLFSAYKEIYQNSWKGHELSYAFIESVCLSALARNQLRLAVLFIDGKAAAAQIWFVVNKRASIFKLAYDPSYQSLSVGSILTMDLFKTVIEKDSVVEVEYGTGNEPYKKNWVEQLRHRIIIDIYNEYTLRGKLLYLAKCLKQKFLRKPY